ncbi:MAG: hypothetical protein IJ173_06095 [Kiritimatiellae bacterium]|nr:hypothetical protein [Kiritimatiellia bacterium]
MKKLMMTTVAALGFAALAQADVLNSTGFEEYGENDFAVGRDDQGTGDNARYWLGTDGGDFSQTVLKKYVDAGIEAPAKVPDAFTNAASNATFLSVDTGNDVLLRRAAANPTETIDLSSVGPVFFDADVKFTASEKDVEASTGDKLLVWLKGDEETTNLVVTAGVYNELTEEYDQTNFTVDGVYAADTWYRLTVKAAVDDNNLTYFNVYIDGEPVEATDKTTDFYSLVQSGVYRYVIAEAGFQGTGALDNVVWTTTDPFPAEATYKLTLTGADFASGVTLDGDAVEDITNISEDLAVSKKSVEVVVNVGIDDGTFTAQSENENVTISTPVRSTEAVEEEGEEVTYYFYTFTVTVEPEAEAEYTIALAFEVGEDDVPTEGEAAAGGSATVKADDAAAAAEAVTVTVDSAVAAVLTDAQKAAFVTSFFTKSVVDNQDGTFTVSVAVNEEAVEDALDVVVAEALETAADGEITKIPAGLCYKIESGSTVGLGTVAKGVSTGTTIEVEGLSPEAGFYKVSLDVAPIAE